MPAPKWFFGQKSDFKGRANVRLLDIHQHLKRNFHYAQCDSKLRARAMTMLRVLESITNGRTVERATRQFGITRQYFYMWLRRLVAAGCTLDGLREKSKRPKRSPNATSEEIILLAEEARSKEGSGGQKGGLNMKNRFIGKIGLLLLAGIIFSCSSLEKRENQAKRGAPLPLNANSAYIFFSHYTTTGDFPGRLIIKKQAGKSELALSFANTGAPSYALYEVEPCLYDAIGFSAGNDPLGDAIGITISLRLNRKWDICAGCVLYVGRLRLDFTRTANAEMTTMAWPMQPEKT